MNDDRELNERVALAEARLEDLHGLDGSHIKFLKGNGRDPAEVRMNNVERDVERMLKVAYALAVASLPGIFLAVVTGLKAIFGAH